MTRTTFYADVTKMKSAQKHIAKRRRELSMNSNRKYLLHLLSLDGYTIAPSDV